MSGSESKRRPGVGNWNVSTVSVAFANLAPLWGALFLGWEVAVLLFLVWFEVLVGSFFDMMKDAVGRDRFRPPGELVRNVIGNLLGLGFLGGLGSFFLYFFLAMFHAISVGISIQEPLDFLVWRQYIRESFTGGLWIVMTSMVVSHLVAFVKDQKQRHSGDPPEPTAFERFWEKGHGNMGPGMGKALIRSFAVLFYLMIAVAALTQWQLKFSPYWVLTVYVLASTAVEVKVHMAEQNRLASARAVCKGEG